MATTQICFHCDAKADHVCDLIQNLGYGLEATLLFAKYAVRVIREKGRAVDPTFCETARCCSMLLLWIAMNV